MMQSPPQMAIQMKNLGTKSKGKRSGSWRLAMLIIPLLITYTVWAQRDSLSFKLRLWHIEDPKPIFDIQELNIGAYDPEHHAIHYFTHDKYWKFDVVTHQWKNLGSLKIDQNLAWAVYDTLQDRLLLFENDVSHVYQVTGDSVSGFKLKQIDKTAYAQNQYGTDFFVDRQDSRIFAFGGYGYWYFKNMITHYDFETHQWLLVPLNRPTPQPTERWQSYGLYWDQKDRLVVIGGQGEPGGRQNLSVQMAPMQLDVWAFSFNKKKWQKLGDIDSTAVTSLFKKRAFGRTSITGLQAVNGRDGIGVLVHQVRGEGPTTEFLGVDLETGDISKLPVNGWVNTTSEDVVNVFWDNRENRFLIITSVRRSGFENLSMRIYEMPVEQPSRFKAYIHRNSLLQPSGSGNGDPVISAFWFKLAGGVLFGLVLGGLIVYLMVPDEEDKVVPVSKSGTPDVKNDPPEFSLNIHIAGEQHVECFGITLDEDLSTKDVELISLLVIERLKGVEWMEIEEIEYSLWEERMNRDYVRKLRNSAIDNINRVVQHLPANKNNKPLIVNRKSRRDRRKIEYGLNQDLQLHFVDIRDHLNIQKVSDGQVELKWKGESIDMKTLRNMLDSKQAISYIDSLVS